MGRDSPHVRAGASTWTRWSPRLRGRLAPAHSRRLPAAGTATGAAALSAALWWIAGSSLQGWAVGLGMDDERGALIASLLIVGAAAAVATAISGRSGAARLGASVATLGIQVGPFLWRGAHESTTPGLTAHITLGGWITQPLGMLLLGAIVAGLGAGVGVVVRRDVVVVGRALRRRPRLWATVPVLVALLAVAASASMVALQEGPVSALFGYSASGTSTGPSSVTQLSNPPAAPSANGLQPDGPPSPTSSGDASTSGGRRSAVPVGRPVPRRTIPSGSVQQIAVAGRTVDVYLPAGYATAHHAFPVVYFLHGYPGNPQQWLGSGAQLPGVLDQLIGLGDMPPIIGVMPDGNGQVLSDAEWGDTERGDTVETWLVSDVVPAVDSRYRTLGAQHRGIAGLSAGGFGAVNLALRNPDVFRWAASWSGYFTARSDIFGSTTDGNSPLEVAGTLPAGERMPLYIANGSEDTEFSDTYKAFVAALKSLQWAPMRSEVVPGGHGWEAWRIAMVHSLEWLDTLWGPAPWPASTPTPAPSPSPSPSGGASPPASPSPGGTPSPSPSASSSSSPSSSSSSAAAAASSGG